MCLILRDLIYQGWGYPFRVKEKEDVRREWEEGAFGMLIN